MTRKYSITVPDIIGRVIDALAELRGEKPTSTASYLLTKHVDEGLRTGLYKDEGSSDVDSIALNLLRSLVANDPLDPAQVAATARALGIAPHELNAKLKKEGNGHEAKSVSTR